MNSKITARCLMGLMGVGLFGCGDEGGGGSGPARLIAISDEAPGASCAHGGQRVDQGTDANGDDVLDADEVESTHRVCNAAPSVLVRVSEEPAGGNCANGGLRVDQGSDDDQSGALSEEEIDSTQYLCGPETALADLIDVQFEAAGANCEFGGQRIARGGDADQDGSLDASEVQTTSYVCDGAPGYSVLARTSIEGPGANCANGGLRMDTGLDDGADGATARDGVLDNGEVDASHYVCDSAPQWLSLVRVTPEAAGSNCASGGQRVDSGTDDGAGGETAGDGMLGAGEVDHTSYVCDGSAGAVSLVEIDDEPAGANCSAGGQRIDSGLDDGDGGEIAEDGMLGAGEVNATEYVCHGDDGVATVARMTGEAAGANCMTGGRRLDSGLDNGDGGGTPRNNVLENGEIDVTQYVCNGATGATGAAGTNGFNSLSRLTAESAGANCANAGQRLDVGLDNGDGGGTARNNVLENGEVDATRYVCNGATGPSGSNGFTTLVSMTSEAAGTNCSAGGQRIQAGLDNGDGGGTARNGTLETGEIDTTAYVCNGTNNTLAVVSLTANNCVVVEHNPTTGDDRGGVAIAGGYFYYRGDVNTVRFDQNGLTNQTGIGAFDGLVSDLESGRLYSLASGADTPLAIVNCTGPASGSLDRLLELNPTTGAVLRSIPLTAPITGFGTCNNSIFAGRGFMLLVNATRVYRIDFASGAVVDLAPRPAGYQPYACENWANWGIAEFDGTSHAMVYRHASTHNIVRTAVLSGTTTTVAAFTALSDTCSITAAPQLNRWYFHHETISQFGGVTETAGYCDATFLR